MADPTIYDGIEELLNLEEIISEKNKKKKIEFGDPDVIRYNNLIKSLSVLSVGDLFEYRSYLVEALEEEKNELKDELGKIKGDLQSKESELKESEEYVRSLEKKGYLKIEKREEILRRLKEFCTQEAYSTIESIFQEVFHENNKEE